MSKHTGSRSVHRTRDTGASPLPAATRTSLTRGPLHATPSLPPPQARLVCVQPSDTVSPTATPAAAAAGPSGGPSPAAPASTACASAPSASPAAASPGPLVGPRCHWYAGSSVLLNSVQVEVTKEDRITLLLPHNQAGAPPCCVHVQQHRRWRTCPLIPGRLLRRVRPLQPSPSSVLKCLAPAAVQADQATDVSSSLRPGINRLTLFWPVGVAGAVVVLRLCTPLAPADLARALAPPLPLPQLLQLLRQYMAGELPPADDNEDEQQEGAGSADGDNTSAAGQDQGRVAATAAAGGEQGPQGVQAGGGEADGGALESGPVTVSLRCPLSGCLVASPAHFGRWCDRNPLAFFDRDAFLQTAQHTGSWLCPATGKLGSANDLRVRTRKLPSFCFPHRHSGDMAEYGILVHVCLTSCALPCTSTGSRTPTCAPCWPRWTPTAAATAWRPWRWWRTARGGPRTRACRT